MEPAFLFVYGTLRRDYGHERHSLLERYATFEGEATVQAQIFDMGRYPGLVLSADPADKVHGEVYRLESAQTDHVLQELDEYEGTEYRREPVTARFADGATAAAWLYVLNRDSQGCPRIPSGDYLQWRAR